MAIENSIIEKYHLEFFKIVIIFKIISKRYH